MGESAMPSLRDIKRKLANPSWPHQPARQWWEWVPERWLNPADAAWRHSVREMRGQWRTHNRQLKRYSRQYRELMKEFHQKKNEIRRRQGNIVMESASALMHEVDQMDGRQFEQFCAEVLRHRGYHVEDTRVTGDFGADLIVTRGSDRISVQCKRYNKRLNGKPIQEVLGSLAMYHCTQAWVMTNQDFTAPAIQLAKANDVRLIDGRALRGMLEERNHRAEQQRQAWNRDVEQLSQQAIHQANLWKQELATMPLGTTISGRSRTHYAN